MGSISSHLSYTLLTYLLCQPSKSLQASTVFCGSSGIWTRCKTCQHRSRWSRRSRWAITLGLRWLVRWTFDLDCGDCGTFALGPSQVSMKGGAYMRAFQASLCPCVLATCWAAGAIGPDALLDLTLLSYFSRQPTASLEHSVTVLFHQPVAVSF